MSQDKLDGLIKEKAGLIAETEILKSKIKAERFNLSRARRNDSSIEMESYKELRAENSKLKGMISTIGRANGDTYKKIGEMIGVSPERARQIIEAQLRRFRGDAAKYECEEFDK